MQRTSNYQLPQWEKTDRILMEDFNDMTAKIDAAIDGVKSEAAGAQSTADTALAHKNYVTGSYQGSSDGTKVTLGFRPSAVITAVRTAKGDKLSTNVYAYIFINGIEYNEDMFKFEDDGFSLGGQHSPMSGTGGTPHVNFQGESYSYIAFR